MSSRGGELAGRLAAGGGPRKRQRREASAAGESSLNEDEVVRVQRDESGTLQMLREMRKQRELMDCSLLVRQCGHEPVEIRAHRAVLCAASRPFCSMLTGGLRERGAEVIELQEVSAASIAQMLEFVYGAEVEINAANALNLYRVSDMYEVLELATACCAYLKKNTTVHNCCTVLAAADTVHCHSVSSHCIEVLKRHFEEATTAQGFVELPQSLLLEVLGESDLSVRSEELVLDALLRWLDHDESRLPALPTLAPAVRWPFIPSSRLARLELDRPALTATAEVAELTREAYRFQALQASCKDDALLSSFPSARTTRRRLRYSDFSRLSFKLAVGTKGNSNSAFNCPEGVAVSAEGHVVVADSLNHRVQVFTFDGQFVRAFGAQGTNPGEFNMPGGVAVGLPDAAGNEHIVVTDQGNGRVQIFTSEGAFVRQIGEPGTEAGKLLEPTGVAVTRHGHIVVADYQNHRVQIFESTGQHVSSFGEHGAREGQFNHPSGIAITQEGNIIVADYQNDRIQIFDESGTFTRTIGKHGAAAGEFDRPFDVAVSSDGHILVTDYENHRVQIFSEDGTFKKEFGSHGCHEGQFDSPGGVAVSSEGLVCVTDCGNGRFQVYTCDGPAP